MKCRKNLGPGRGRAGLASRKARFVWFVPFALMACPLYIVIYHFALLPYGHKSNGEGRMTNFPPLDVAHDRKNDGEGGSSSTADAPGEGGPFFWEKADNCHVVEDVCHVRDINRWFYFTHEDGWEGGGPRRDKHQQHPKQQPSLSLHLGVEYAHPGVIQSMVDYNVYFDVSSILSPKPTLSQMKTMPSLGKCSLSKIDNHVVIQSKFNHMIGEFYVRSLLPLSGIMNMTTTKSLLSSIGIGDDSAANNNLQFYVHLLASGTKLLDAHMLFLSGLASNHKAREWADMFMESHNTASDGDPVPECECYKRFVLCGYRRLADNLTACALPGIENVTGLPANAKSVLCGKGIDLNTMRSLNDGSLIDRLLKKAGSFTDIERSIIIEYAKNATTNVALHQPSRASFAYNPSRFAFDGDISTMWRSDGKDEQFLEVDLGELHHVEKIVIVWDKDAAKSYDIRTSIDRVQWTTVWSNSDHSAVRRDAIVTAIESPIMNATCQYIRMQGHMRISSPWGRYSVHEMEVYGVKLNTTSPSHAVDFDVSDKITLVVDGDVHGGRTCSKNDFKGCDSFALLKKTLLNELLKKYPDLSNDIESYRLSILRDKMRALPAASQRSNTTNHHEWTFIGLTQRNKRRSWLNLKQVIAHCNERYRNYQILCVEVNVETISSNSSSGGDGGHHYEQLVMHRSMDAFIGIHGAQLTQGVVLPAGAIVVELLPWVPQGDYFSGRKVAGEWKPRQRRKVVGEWTQRRHAPTPLGIIYHNTDLNHVGYPLGRDSVPLCQNVSNIVMHNFHDEEKMEDRLRNETELEYCLLTKFVNQFDWGERDFTVEITMIDKFIDTFILPKKRSKTRGPLTKTGDTYPLCSDLRESGEKNNFVLYNVWCKEDKITGNISVQHYYQVKK